MCGVITAFTDSKTLEPAIRRALQRMYRRGPNGQGLWQEDGVCMAHRRLAILDLDERAAQPMQSPCGRYVIVFNGEIYNFRGLRDALARQGVAFPPADEVRERVRTALRESVARHLVADVPVGVFLSGGIDSGTLAGLMVEAGASELEGVTIAYDEFAGRPEDEAPVAAQIAARYGIRHYVRRVAREEFIADLPRIFDAMDQPSIDGINTWYASKAAAERCLKVVVSGLGGDELFQGYESFQYFPPMVELWRALTRFSGVQPIGKLAGSLQARRTGNARWRYAAEWARTISGAWWLRRSLYSPEICQP